MLVVGAFSHIYLHDRRRFSRYWIVAWAAQLARAAAEFAIALGAANAVLGPAINGFSVVTAVYLHAGALTFDHRARFGRLSLLAALAGVVASIAARYGFGVPPEAVRYAVFVFFGAAQIATGAPFIRHARRRKLGLALFSGIALILWGLHRLDYPLLVDNPVLSALGFQLGTTFLSMVTIGVALMLLEESSRSARDSADMNRTLVEVMSDALFISDFQDDPAGRIIDVNKAAVELVGYSREELLAMTIQRLFAPGHPENTLMAPPETGPGSRFRAVRIYRRKDGSEVPVEINACRVLLNGRHTSIAVTRDLRPLLEEESRLKTALAEKELLLKEIHHRVKNNLQIVSSLIGIQKTEVPDPAFRALLETSQGRIRSMALVHETLYTSGQFAALDLTDYLRRIVSDIASGFGHGPSHRLDLPDAPLLIPLDFAIPCGLIVVELVVNAMKYAFPDGRSGVVIFGLEREDSGFRLRVEDDGAGLAADRRHGIGLTLVESLVAQIGATAAILPGPGTRWIVSVPLADG